MKDPTLGSFLADVTVEQTELLARMDQAVRAVVAIALPDPRFAAAGVFGCSLQMLVEHMSFDEAQVHTMVKHWFENNSDVRAGLMRMQMRAVPDPVDPEAE